MKQPMKQQNMETEENGNSGTWKQQNMELTNKTHYIDTNKQ